MHVLFLYIVFKCPCLCGSRVSVVEVLSECCLLSYMARVESRLSFLFRLINIINVQTLTQVGLHLNLFACTQKKNLLFMTHRFNENKLTT